MKIPDDEKPFEGILGNASELVILEHLIACEGLDFNIKELAEIAEVHRNTVSVIINRLLEWDMVKITRSMGKVAFYTVNMESSLINRILGFNQDLIDILEPVEIMQTVTIDTVLSNTEEVQWLTTCAAGVPVTTGTVAIANPSAYTVVDKDDLEEEIADEHWTMAFEPRKRKGVPEVTA